MQVRPATKGAVFTSGPGCAGRRFSKEVVIQNQGKQPVTLAWVNTTLAAIKAKLNKAAKKESGPPKKQVRLSAVGQACHAVQPWALQWCAAGVLSSFDKYVQPEGHAQLLWKKCDRFSALTLPC